MHSDENLMFYVYILDCGKSVYTGHTQDLLVRWQQHKSGKGAKFTKLNPPKSLLYYEIYPTRSEAMKREIFIKKLTRKQKLELCQNQKPKNN